MLLPIIGGSRRRRRRSRAARKEQGFRAPGRAAATRGDLDASARRISTQIAEAERPRNLLGHSQAALILDRILARDLPAPDAAVNLSAPPVTPPPIRVPRPHAGGPGRVGGDLTRALSALLDLVRLAPFDVDAPAAPPHLRRVVVRNAEVPRLAVWALGDSVWLDGDWRRPGEVNIVVLTDHVGATKNARALASTRRWFRGQEVASDEASWRSWLVNLYRFAFEPWRP